MIEQIKQALIKETERHIAQDILYDDVYVGPFTEKDGVDCAIHAVDWYRNHIWHDIDEEPDFSKFILLYDDKGGYLSPASRWPFKNMPGFVEAMNKKYGANYTKWVYMEDILPSKKN